MEEIKLVICIRLYIPCLSRGTVPTIPINGSPFGPGIFESVRMKGEFNHRQYFPTQTTTIKDEMKLNTLNIVVTLMLSCSLLKLFYVSLEKTLIITSWVLVIQKSSGWNYDLEIREHNFFINIKNIHLPKLLNSSSVCALMLIPIAVSKFLQRNSTT